MINRRIRTCNQRWSPRRFYISLDKCSRLLYEPKTTDSFCYSRISPRRVRRSKGCHDTDKSPLERIVDEDQYEKFLDQNDDISKFKQINIENEIVFGGENKNAYIRPDTLKIGGKGGIGYSSKEVFYDLDPNLLIYQDGWSYSLVTYESFKYFVGSFTPPPSLNISSNYLSLIFENVPLETLYKVGKNTKYFNLNSNDNMNKFFARLGFEETSFLTVLQNPDTSKLYLSLIYPNNIISSFEPTIKEIFGMLKWIYTINQQGEQKFEQVISNPLNPEDILMDLIDYIFKSSESFVNDVTYGQNYNKSLKILSKFFIEIKN